MQVCFPNMGKPETSSRLGPSKIRLLVNIAMWNSKDTSRCFCRLLGAE